MLHGQSVQIPDVERKSVQPSRNCSGPEEKVTRAPRGDTRRAGLLLGSDFSRQIPRDFHAGSHLAHRRLLPAFLHPFLLLDRPSRPAILNAIGLAPCPMARPSISKWTNPITTILEKSKRKLH